MYRQCYVHTSTYSCRRFLTLLQFPSNGTLYSCFTQNWFLWRIRCIVERLTATILLKMVSSGKIWFWVLQILMVLFAKIIVTIGVSCSCANIRLRPPWYCCLSTLETVQYSSAVHIMDVLIYNRIHVFYSYAGMAITVHVCYCWLLHTCSHFERFEIWLPL